jgi:hypothetical protein
MRDKGMSWRAIARELDIDQSVIRRALADSHSVLAAITGQHQCLVAEISYDADPVPGEAPASSDRLAQRNLAVVSSGNPGGPLGETSRNGNLRTLRSPVPLCGDCKRPDRLGTSGTSDCFLPIWSTLRDFAGSIPSPNPNALTASQFPYRHLI